jgi:hypothetical protein
VPSKKTYAELHAELIQPTPKELIKTKEQGGAVIPFLNITDAHDLLDARVGPGNWAVKILDGHQVGDQYVIHVRAIIYASDGTFEQDSTGFEEVGLDKFGDTSSNAYAMAVKRAFEIHGLSRDLWRGEAKPGRERGDNERPAAVKPKNPLARGVSDLATPKQIGMARTLAAEKGFEDLEAICYEAYGLKTDEISKQAASWLIDHVKNLKRAQNRPQTEKGGSQPSQAANASHAPATPQPAPIQGTAPPANTTENEPSTAKVAAKPAQRSAIESLKTRWRNLRTVPESDFQSILEIVGCMREDDMTEFQAGQLIKKLSDKINEEIKEAKKAK